MPSQPRQQGCKQLTGENKMSSSSSTSSGGIGVLGLLGIVFVVMKLMGYITWSWWWVTAPFWGGFALVLAIFLIAFVFMLIFGK
jgi:hypothetical protein